jgi:hypothetical protein
MVRVHGTNSHQLVHDPLAMYQQQPQQQQPSSSFPGIGWFLRESSAQQYQQQLQQPQQQVSDCLQDGGGGGYALDRHKLTEPSAAAVLPKAQQHPNNRSSAPQYGVHSSSNNNNNNSTKSEPEPESEPTGFHKTPQQQPNQQQSFSSSNGNPHEWSCRSIVPLSFSSNNNPSSSSNPSSRVWFHTRTVAQAYLFQWWWFSC